MGSIRYEVDDKAIAWVTFDRADKLNAMTPDMMDVFAEHMMKAREDNETSKRRRLAAGELGLDIYDMRGKLAAAGLKYYESADDVK